MNKQGLGFLTIAQNTSAVDYLRLAYAQAMNIKALHPNASYAVIVDTVTNQSLTANNRKIFDHVIVLANDLNDEASNWKLANEYQVFKLSPYKETIKLESDLLFTRSIEHWYPAFRLRDLMLSYGCKSYRQTAATSRVYRKFFDDNELPDVYSGLMYFRYSKFASDFFLTAEGIFNNWQHLKNYVLKNCREETPSTDVLYAVTAKVMGIENCAIPTLDFINFVHMKPAINGWGNSDRTWTQMIMHERDNDMIRIHNLNQYYPVHYHDKSYMTNDIINHYEQRFGIRS